MSDDIVENLRASASRARFDRALWSGSKLMEQAADEITHLRMIEREQAAQIVTLQDEVTQLRAEVAVAERSASATYADLIGNATPEDIGMVRLTENDHGFTADLDWWRFPDAPSTWTTRPHRPFTQEEPDE